MANSADHEQAATPEWTYQVAAEEVTGKPVALSMVADEDVRKNLARRLNLLALDRLEADLQLVRQDKRVVHVSGSLRANVTQTCVVTLQPVSTDIEDRFEAWFADPEQAVSFARARHEKEKRYGESERPMLEEFEDPEPIIEGRIDVGELVAQYLSLALDPYPHASGVEPVGDEEETSAQARPQRENPFAALKTLREKAETTEE